MYSNLRMQGNFGMGQAIAHFTKLGWIVSIPLTDSQRYDIIVDDGSTLHRVQIKTATSDKVELRTKGGNKSGTGKTKHFDTSECDILFVAHVDGRNWSIISNTMTNRSSLSLNGLDTLRLSNGL